MSVKKVSCEVDKSSLCTPRLNAFYDTVLLPPHLRNLLYLHGVYEVEDLTWFDEAAITDIKGRLLAGTLGGAYADFSLKSDQKKFFGAHMKPQQFEFRYVDLQVELTTMCLMIL